jgi:hypothetical protein
MDVGADAVGLVAAGAGLVALGGYLRARRKSARASSFRDAKARGGALGATSFLAFASGILCLGGGAIEGVDQAIVAGRRAIVEKVEVRCSLPDAAGSGRIEIANRGDERLRVSLSDVSGGRPNPLLLRLPDEPAPRGDPVMLGKTSVVLGPSASEAVPFYARAQRRGVFVELLPSVPEPWGGRDDGLQIEAKIGPAAGGWELAVGRFCPYDAR